MPDEEAISKETKEVRMMAAWLTHKTWLIVLKPLRNKPKRADQATLVFDCLIEMLEKGEEGRQTTIAALERAIEVCYGFTEASRLAYEHYRGCLKMKCESEEDTPETLLKGAIERTTEMHRKWLEQEAERALRGE